MDDLTEGEERLRVIREIAVSGTGCIGPTVREMQFLLSRANPVTRTPDDNLSEFCLSDPGSQREVHMEIRYDRYGRPVFEFIYIIT